MGAWLSVLPIHRQWDGVRDYLFLIYGINLPDLPSHCNVCWAAFSICHALYWKRGGLVTASHNELRDGVAKLAGKAFTLVQVRNDPKIFTGRVVQG